MTASKSDVAGMKAMLTGVFAKAAEAKGKAARPAGAAPARKAPAAPDRDPAVRLSLGPDAAEDAPARPSEPDFADRLEPAIQALARDLGRLLAAFGMDGSDAAAAEAALAARFGDRERRAAVAALDGPAGGLRPLAGEARQDVAVEVSGIGLALAAGQVEVRLDGAALLLARVPAEEKGEGLAAMLGVLRSAIRPGKGLTVETDRVAIDDLGPVMDALTAAMTAPPQGLEGTVTLTPLAGPTDGGRIELSLSLGRRLGETAAAASVKPVRATEKPVGDLKVGDLKDGGFDVRI
ncbi:hypothetical protein TSH100_06165 [Azospirillum sp. TSH100]|uniref:hypothetical protein n=1 Tax=Azospirillum sp. TSH100 TaxID=652764 RepID=UPI000D607285|nr:hypothetical protein [Azospirillum sp. TSH100]PWC88801.1 hypothetical protein TSH100_06165 [Azospirillum sp. TSH100]QCG86741.1 hypothetical protein E6C72_02720 [Azospirillum sp. TSH100]